MEFMIGCKNILEAIKIEHSKNEDKNMHNINL